MKKIFLLLLVSALTFTSCSNNEKKEGEVAAAEQSEEISIDDSDFVVDANEDLNQLEEATMQPTDESVAVLGSEAPSPTDEILLEENVALEKDVIVTASDYYEVQKGETLMWIAFKLYGDYRKWRDIQAMNQEALADGLQAGDKIKYQSGQFNWNPVGLPHLIRRGETLGVISQDKYGTPAKWRSIWDNNRDMIKDPNLIFAGFTLYYVPEERDVASESM